MGYREAVPYSYLERHTATDAMLVVVFHELKGAASAGELMNAHIPQPVPFYGYGDLLLKMERIYDLLKLPQSLRRFRHLGSNVRWKGTSLGSARGWDMRETAWNGFQAGNGGRLCLAVQVLYRQHNSWQGFMNVKNQKIFYQSALELLHLIDDCVQEAMPGE